MLSTISFGLDIAAICFTALYLVQLSGHLIKAESENVRWSAMRSSRGLLPALIVRKRV